jgi:hypothetical protein
MGVFDDKKFEELDWISQATEPIDSELNEILGALPEELVIDFATYKKMVGDNYTMDLHIDRVVNYMVKTYTNKTLSWGQKNVINPCFTIEMDDTVYLDFETQQIDGMIKVIKIQSTMDEKVLEGLLGREGIESLSSMYFHGPGITRANEIMEILGGIEDAAFRTRSERKKKHYIVKRLTAMFKTNEWKIKDTELANKVGRWIKEYIVDGNLAAFSNFCRLKVMTHKDQPIYSMEEVE